MSGPAFTVEERIRELAAQASMTVKQVRVPPDSRLPAHVLVDGDEAAARAWGLDLSEALQRRMVVVTPGRPLHVLLQVYGFLGEELLFAVEDPWGVIAYFRDDAAVIKRAYGSGRANQQAFEHLTGTRLTIMAASEELRRRVQAELAVRARGYHGFPPVPVDEVLAGQHQVISEAQLRREMALPDEEFAWNLAPAGVQRGSYEFRVSLNGRPVEQVHDRVREALVRVAGGFGLDVHDVTDTRPGNGKYRTYYLLGELGSAQVKVFHSDKHKELTCIYPEEKSGGLIVLMPLLVSMLRSRVE